MLISFGSERVNCLRIKQKNKKEKGEGKRGMLIWAGVSTLNFECKLWRRFQKEP